ncbi:MAG: hypothetical protein Q7S34_02785 [bacterium]|nr:hypothetical protein [bacterium]
METPKNLLGNEPVKQLPKEFKTPVNMPIRPVSTGPKKSSLSTTAKVVIAVVIVLLVSGLAYWFSFAKKENSVPKETINNISTTENITSGVTTSATTPKVRAAPISVSGANAIATNDQLAGDTAEVTMITLSVPGWVAIHEDKNGLLGNILGAGRFDPGIHLGEIELLRGTVSGGTYHAVLYQDNGDRQFDSSTDAPIKNAEGRIIEATFKAE